MSGSYLSKNKARITLILFLLLLAGIAVMRYFDSFLITQSSPNGIVSFELAKDSYLSAEMINAWDSRARTAAGMSMGFDFLFLLIYASFLSMLIFIIGERLFVKPNKNVLKNVLILSPFIAAFFDVAENFSLIQLLMGDIEQKWSLTAYYAATIKFGILFFVIGYILVGGVISIFKRNK